MGLRRVAGRCMIGLIGRGADACCTDPNHARAKRVGLPHSSVGRATRRRWAHFNAKNTKIAKTIAVALRASSQKRILEAEEVEYVALGRVWILEKTAPATVTWPAVCGGR